ncbi:phosphoenolpyruvate--protein phosphotransferase [Paludicola sp. MB14-C6]|uniref:phosphoenolpyruvate--protein phosphotransferase n=1 Tax=Paludihabitans sp. MB14-C6 TaxID=3070656 RepID=UPI0035A3933D
MVMGKGISVFSGVAVGKIQVYEKPSITEYQKAFDAAIEKQKYFQATQDAKKQLMDLFEKTKIEIGESEAMIIDVQMMMLDDQDFINGVLDMIGSQQCTVSYAVSETGKRCADLFSAMDDTYMQARALDVMDITNRLLAILSGQDKLFQLEQPAVIVADDLTPSETIQFDKTKILAFVTRHGSANSHTAILARTLNIPTLIQADIPIDTQLNGKPIAIDGITGKFYIDPSNTVIEQLQNKQRVLSEQQDLLKKLKNKQSITTDGKRINIYANISGPQDLNMVLENDSDGIGLFRSEFLYIGKPTYPTEEEQFDSYYKVVKAMNGKKVIIRTLDIGADKKADYFNLAPEDNPAMGYRAIRICLTKLDIFKTQLRAIYRASAYGNVAIMFPMIISVEEIQKIKVIIKEVKADLNSQNIAFGNVEIGIMIETPAAVMMSNELAKEVDFFSVGTNDLTQYTLAIDRQNYTLEPFFNPHHPAVLKMLRIVVENAHANGIWAGICGELASDFELTETFIQMGYDELSVSPIFTLALRKIIRESKVTENE